jgi:hypothetical protein
MDNFLRCLCDEDFTALIIDGTASENELKEAWILILSEYYELKGDTDEGSAQWVLNRNIQRLQNHLFLIERCVLFLDKQYSDSIAESVRKLGYYFKPTIKEPDEYRNQLHVIVGKSKTKYIQLQQLLKELEQQVSKIEDKKPDRLYFEQMLIQIEEMQGGAVYNMETLSVQKYVMLEKKYINYIDQIKAHQKLKK